MSNEIWARIEQALAAKKLSSRAASLLATDGRNPDILRTIKDGRTRLPRGEALVRIADVLGVTTEWIVDGIGAPPVPVETTSTRPLFIKRKDAPRWTAPDPAKPRAAQMMRTIDPSDASRPVPVLGTAAASVAGGFALDGVVEWVRRPPGLIGAPNAYALWVAGDSMSPRHRPGDLVFVSPDRPPRLGDDVVVQTRDHAGAPTIAWLKTLARTSGETLAFQQLHPEATIDWSREVVVAVHRVLTMREIVGA